VLSYEPLDVLAQDVCLQIHPISNFPLAQSRHFICVRDNPDLKLILLNAGDGQTDSVHSNRALQHYIAHDLRICLYPEQPILLRPLPPCDLAQAVDMTGYEVAIQPSIGTQRTLKIHERTNARVLQTRKTPSLFQQIELDDRTNATSIDLHRRQTTTVHRHAVADFQAAGTGFRANCQSNAVRRRFNACDGASVFDNA